MERSDEAAAGRAAWAPVSAAILAAAACLPIVIAAGFLTDRSAAVPGDISLQALRGPVDGPVGQPARAPAQAD